MKERDEDSQYDTQVFRGRELPPDTDEPKGIIGRFELLHKLGEGGFSRVFKARDSSTGEIVAIKILRSTAVRNSDAVERLKREFDAISSLQHKSIIRAMEYSQDGWGGQRIHYMVLEYVDGWDLGKALRELKKIPYRSVSVIIRDVAGAVDYAHRRNFLHRDIKPHNILLPREGVAKLSDFGLAKYLPDQSGLTRTGDTLGTLAFMPPEQFRDSKNVKVTSDIYSLSMTFLLMVTGRYPFQSQYQADWHSEKSIGLTISENQFPELSKRNISAIAKSLSPEPSDRHQSALAFVEDLDL